MEDIVFRAPNVISTRHWYRKVNNCKTWFEIFFVHFFYTVHVPYSWMEEVFVQRSQISAIHTTV